MPPHQQDYRCLQPTPDSERERHARKKKKILNRVLAY